MESALLIATHNAHKTAEFRALLASQFETVTDLSSVPDAVPPEEDGATFAENSAIKAIDASRRAPGLMVLADDSGLEVDALGGAPGVHSSRYAGEDADDASNRAKLLSELARPENATATRSARFRCVLTAARDGLVLAQFDGAVEGRIAESERGSGGFGYDSLFLPEGEEASFGELPESTKNAMSHRARAIAKLIAWLREREV